MKNGLWSEEGQVNLWLKYINARLCAAQIAYGVIQPLVWHAAGLCHDSGMLTPGAVSSLRFLTGPALAAHCTGLNTLHCWDLKQLFALVSNTLPHSIVVGSHCKITKGSFIHRCNTLSSKSDEWQIRSATVTHRHNFTVCVILFQALKEQRAGHANPIQTFTNNRNKEF